MDDQNLKDLEREQADNQLIGDAFQHLLDTYLSSRHRKKVDIVTKAFNFARQAHKGVRRLSGEPYIMHPIAVAQIACEEMGLGSTSICAALLHDVVEEPWGQQAVRFFDPDGNLVELGESIPTFVRRHHAAGLSPEAVAERTGVPLEAVLQYVFEA